MKEQNSFLNFLYPLSVIGDFNTQILGTMAIIFAATQLNMPPSIIGWVSSAFGLSYLVMAALLGRLGDRVPRRYSLVCATVLQVVFSAYLLAIMILSPPWILIGLFLGFIGFGCAYGFFWPAIEALISEQTNQTPQTHERAIRNLCLSWGLGNALGPFAAGYFAEKNIILGMGLAMGLYCIAFLLVFFKVPLISQSSSKNLGQPREKINLKSIDNKAAQYGPILILIGMMIYAVLARVIFSYFTNYAVIPGGLGWNPALVGWIILFVGIGRFCFFLSGIYFHPSFKGILYSFLVVGFILINLIWVRLPWIIAILFFFFGFAIGRIYYNSLELLMRQENEEKGAKAGLFESMIGVGAGVSPVIAGVLASVNLILPFIVFGIFTFLICIIYYLYLRRMHESAEQ